MKGQPRQAQWERYLGGGPNVLLLLLLRPLLLLLRRSRRGHTLVLLLARCLLLLFLPACLKRCKERRGRSNSSLRVLSLIRLLRLLLLLGTRLPSWLLLRWRWQGLLQRIRHKVPSSVRQERPAHLSIGSKCKWLGDPGRG